jgi:predicted RNase H-like nuclease
MPELLAGVDGCAGGWVVALADGGFTKVTLSEIKTFADLFSQGEAPTIVAVDMPIGLPEETGPKGRTPERKAVAKQGFHIFSKIVDIDSFLQRRRELLDCVYEVHPEVAFWRMNGSKPVPEPKKVKGKAYPPGIELRCRLLVAAGVPAHAIDIPLPRPVARDDWVDALAGLVVARRLARREAISFPSPPESDRLGIPIAIWI